MFCTPRKETPSTLETFCTYTIRVTLAEPPLVLDDLAPPDNPAFRLVLDIPAICLVLDNPAFCLVPDDPVLHWALDDPAFGLARDDPI